MVALLERSTRFPILVKLYYKGSDYSCLNYADKLNELTQILRYPLTYDRSSELTVNKIIDSLAKAKLIISCYLQSPWQWGTNEIRPASSFSFSQSG